jgi:hypothetical protein
MFHEILIDEPIEKIVDDWNFFDEKIIAKFTRFRPLGQNIYGIRRRDLSGEEIIDPLKGNISQMIELGPKGVIEVDHHPMSLHVTTGGTPHRVRHNFGFWHINDMDELYLGLPNPEGDPLGHYLVIMQTPVGSEGDSWAWYCEKCLTMLFERHFATGQYGLQGLFKSSEMAVREYNSEATTRTCPECGHLNPMAYAWNINHDTPEERAARTLW